MVQGITLIDTRGLQLGTESNSLHSLDGLCDLEHTHVGESLREILGETFLVASRVYVIFFPLFLLLLRTNFLFQRGHI